MTRRSLILMGALAFPIALPAPTWAAQPGAVLGQDLSEAELKDDLMFSMEVLVMSADGNRLYRVEESGEGSIGAQLGFSIEEEGQKSFLKASGFMDGQGPGIKVEKYARNSGKDQNEKLLDGQTLRLKDFTSAVYEIGRRNDRKMVLRVNSFLRQKPPARDVAEYMLSLDGLLVRNGSEIIIRGLSVCAQIVKVSSPKMGTLRVGLQKFKGAEPIGIVEGRVLNFRIGTDSYEWMTENPILGPGRWIAWIRLDPKPEGGNNDVIGGESPE